MHSVIKTVSIISVFISLVAYSSEDHSAVINLQGTVFNAITGERIDSEELNITIVQGDQYRSVYLNGEYNRNYYIRDIPTSKTNNTALRIKTSASGFQTFISTVNFSIQTQNRQSDNVYHIADIYLYPLGKTAPDQTIRITYNGKPVPNATVLFNPVTSTNTLLAEQTNIIAPTAGFKSAIVAATNSNGEITITGSDLVLGGRYNATVLPTEFKGIQLATKNNISFNVGISPNNAIREIVMTDLALGNDNGLYVTSASNEYDKSFNQNGELTIRLSLPVDLVSAKDVTASLANNQSARLDISNAPDSTVNINLEDNGHTIILSSNFAMESQPVIFNGNNDNTADNGMMVSYNNLVVRLKSANQTNRNLYDVFQLTSLSGSTVKNTVQVTPAF
ncbi:hypothetical protein [Bermanella sp. R86510]|uniref:hypothetical protein n=1 Tax=unclassified Bermanella TaxID=2627862 RepID=UPI0037CC36CB